MPRGKGVVLYSGGLDSLLAAKILMDQGLDITGFHAVLPFYPPDGDTDGLLPVKLAGQIGLRLQVYRCGSEYIEMLKSPSRGYGKNMNPCIDCKIHFIKKAGEFMKEIGADFTATGEVVGQRPMSQLKHTLNHIENESGLKGRLLRPLSAKLLRPTVPETRGIVDREKLLDINGRSRKRQMELAGTLGIREYTSPAGGCLLTDENFSRRIRDLFNSDDVHGAIDVYLLTVGRHFRVSAAVRAIVGRNEHENRELEKYAGEADYLMVPDFKGPSVFVRGGATGDDMTTAASIISRYSGGNGGGNIRVYSGGSWSVMRSGPAIDDAVLDAMRI